AGDALNDVLSGLGDSIDETDDGGAGAERLSEEDRKHGVEHLGGGVAEETGEGEKECVGRETRERSREGFSAAAARPAFLHFSSTPVVRQSWFEVVLADSANHFAK